MARATTAKSFDRSVWMRAADYMATIVAITVPWSSSATSIAIVLWLIVLIPALDWQALRRELTIPAGGLPVALVAFGALGMLWAGVPIADRLHGFESFLKLLVIPLLLVHFRQSERAYWPAIGFLASACMLLIASVALVTVPNVQLLGKSPGVPVKDYIAQSGEFTLAAFGLLYFSLQKFRERDWRYAIGAALLACAFLADIFYVTTSRTTLVTIPVLLALFVLTQFAGWIRLAMIAAGIAAVFAALTLTPVARDGLGKLKDEVDRYIATGARTSAGERLEMWSKAATMVQAAPVTGHGTGAIREMYRRAAEGKSGIAAEIPDNPHNQTLAIAIQLGLAGVLLLFAMWIAHLWLFWSASGFFAITGLTVVAQNVVGSFFNSHLGDFTHGWIYVFGVGIAGGAVLAQSGKRPRAASKKKRRTR